jgi:hypothetical protein
MVDKRRAHPNISKMLKSYVVMVKVGLSSKISGVGLS